MNITGELVLATNAVLNISGNGYIQTSSIQTSNNSVISVGASVLVSQNLTVSNSTLVIRSSGNVTVLGSFALSQGSTLNLASNSSLVVKGRLVASFQGGSDVNQATPTLPELW